MKDLLARIGSKSAAVLSMLVLAPWAQGAGLMTPSTGHYPQLTIQQHHVNVIVEDGYAITSVDQVFQNPNAVDLEAIYSFPVPEKASVGEFTYWIDDVPITGEVVEKDRATEIYQQEKSQGREVAVTEKNQYRTFDSKVYPVRANSDVRIRLVYIQPAHIDLGIGRYAYPLEEGGVDEETLAFWNYNDKVEGSFSFNLKMRSSYPIDDFRLPKHPDALITRHSDKEWEVELGSKQPGNNAEDSFNSEAELAVTEGSAVKLDKDIVVYWRHQQGLPGSIDMVAYKPEGQSRGTFMMTVTPGDDLSAINAGRDWVFVLDFSGSMQGKYHSLVEGVKQGLNRLDPLDRFKIILFNNRARELTKGYVPVRPESIALYTQKLENLTPDGGTNLYAGLEKGIRGLDADRPSAVLLVTDGVANVGRTEKKAFLKLLETHDVRLFSFVMGNSANRPLLEGMTKISNGFAMSVSNSDDIVGRIVQTADKLNHQAYRDVSIDIDGVKVRNLSPDRIGTVYRGQQMIVFGHYWGDGTAEITISGKVAGETRNYQSWFTFPAANTRNPELERLWAYATIEDLQNAIDYLGGDKDAEQAVVDIALEYGLVTDYTSMIVLREELYQQYGIDRKNESRVAKEHAAQALRSSKPVQTHQIDQKQPAFTGSRAYPSGSGGAGAAGPWTILAMLILLAARYRTRSVY